MFKNIIKITVFTCFLGLALPVCQAQDEFKGYSKQKDFGGHTQYLFWINKIGCRIVLPEKQAEGKPWMLRARFWGRFPYVDNALLQEGYALCYTEVAGKFGNDTALERFDALYERMTTKHGFSKKVVLQGMSRGGLPVMNWAAKNPDKVSVVYTDSGVLDFKSWPGGKGKGKGGRGEWRQVQRVYKLTEEQAVAYKGNPVDNAEKLAKSDVAICILTGGADDVVPQDENGLLYAKRYAEKGGKKLKIIIKSDCGHHPHGLPNPKLVVDFIKAHTPGMGGEKEYSKVVLPMKKWKETMVKTKDANITIFGIAVADRVGLELGFDGQGNTKLCVSEPTTWVQFDYKVAKAIKSYSITSANDNPNRDPRDWTLQGSADGKTWQELDNRSGETFKDRKLRRVFAIAKPASFKYYRMDITKNSGGRICQFAELELLETPVK